MNPLHPPAQRDAPAPPHLARTALRLGIVLEALAILKLLPAGAYVFLGLAVLTLLALVMWHPVATLAVAAAIGTVILARRRAH